MATYISTLKFTEKGVQAIGETCKREAAFTAAAKKMGVKIVSVYWTLGPFDGLIVFDAADDKAATAVMLNLAARGNVHTSTSRAFSASEMEKIVKTAGK